MNKILQSAKVNYAINSLMFERRIQSKVNAIVYNEKLINYMKSTVEAQKKLNDKLYVLYLFKRVFASSIRTPDQAHFYLFEDEYLLDREMYNIDKWLEVEIEFYRNIQTLEVQVSHQELVVAKAQLGKKWVTGEAVKEMFRWSKSTLNRRLAEGMPFHPKGKTKLFDLDEVGEWFRKSED